MSSNQSDRAGGRTRDLRGELLSRLRGHAPLTDRFERVAGVDDGASVIVPSPALDRSHRTTGGEPPGVALGVRVVAESSDRENRQERVRLIGQFAVEFRERALDANGVAWLDEINDEIGAIATAHTEAFRALGATGGTPDPVWDDDRDRYVTASRYDFERWG